MPVKPGSKRVGARRGKPATPPAPHVSPVMKEIFAHLDEVQMSDAELSRRAGPTPPSISKWRRGTSPSLGNVEALAQVLGLKLVLVPADG